MDLLLDPVTHDIVWSNEALHVTKTPQEVVAQRLKIKLWTFQGEWFLNAALGIPYFQSILGKGRLKTSIDAIFQQAILSDPDVVEIIEYGSSLHVDTRSFKMEFRVRTVTNFITDTIEITTLGV